MSAHKNFHGKPFVQHTPAPMPTNPMDESKAHEAKKGDTKQDAGEIKKTGAYKGKSNQLGYGGRSQQLLDKGVPRAVVGLIARRNQSAPGQKNYHGGKKA